MSYAFIPHGRLAKPSEVSEDDWADILSNASLTFDGDVIDFPGLRRKVGQVTAVLTRMQNTDPEVAGRRGSWEQSALAAEHTGRDLADVRAMTAPHIAAGTAAERDIGGSAETLALRSHGASERGRLSAARSRQSQAVARSEQEALSVALATNTLTEAKMVYATEQIPLLERYHELLNIVRAYEELPLLSPLPADLARRLVDATGRRVLAGEAEA